MQVDGAEAPRRLLQDELLVAPRAGEVGPRREGVEEAVAEQPFAELADVRREERRVRPPVGGAQAEDCLRRYAVAAVHRGEGLHVDAPVRRLGHPRQGYGVFADVVAEQLVAVVAVDDGAGDPGDPVVGHRGREVGAGMGAVVAVEVFGQGVGQARDEVIHRQPFLPERQRDLAGAWAIGGGLAVVVLGDRGEADPRLGHEARDQARVQAAAEVERLGLGQRGEGCRGFVHLVGDDRRRAARVHDVGLGGVGGGPQGFEVERSGAPAQQARRRHQADVAQVGAVAPGLAEGEGLGDRLPVLLAPDPGPQRGAFDLGSEGELLAVAGPEHREVGERIGDEADRAVAPVDHQDHVMAVEIRQRARAVGEVAVEGGAGGRVRSRLQGLAVGEKSVDEAGNLAVVGVAPGVPGHPVERHQARAAARAVGPHRRETVASCEPVAEPVESGVDAAGSGDECADDACHSGSPRLRSCKDQDDARWLPGVQPRTSGTGRLALPACVADDFLTATGAPVSCVFKNLSACGGRVRATPEFRDGLMGLDDFIALLKAAHERLAQEKLRRFARHVPFGDLVSERDANARRYGFGEGTTMYDSALVLGEVRVGRHTWIGPHTILDGSGGLVIGDHVSVSAGVQIYSHDTVARSTSQGTAPVATAPTTIGDGVYIGPNTIIQKGVTIGDGAVIGAMSLVNRDVPPGGRAWGCPARLQPPASANPEIG